ncbi:MAG TPA: DUF1330 domain-containing protein [Acidobacteriota bacterium]|nr:DUF1330 domain-containing protein [Acidobacteriota bacterium]
MNKGRENVVAGYMIVRVEVTDWEQYQKYMEVTPGIVAQYGGRFIVRGGRTSALEGPEESTRVVVVEFPSFDRAVEFYNSPEYTEARRLRQGAANAQFLAVEGVEG